MARGHLRNCQVRSTFSQLRTGSNNLAVQLAAKTVGTPISFVPQKTQRVLAEDVLAAALSIEESGKLTVLRGLAIAKDAAEVKAAWRDYRSHQAKNAAWIIADLVRKGARTLDDLRPIFDPASDHPSILDTVKQLGFYTDCYEKAHWSEPPEVVPENVCRRWQPQRMNKLPLALLAASS